MGYKKLTKFGLIISLACTFILTGYAATRGPSNPQDPYEHLNRKIFTMNEHLDEHVLKPIAKTYQYMLPPQIRTGVSNVYKNVDEITVVANDLLQGDFINAMADSWRFVINSTLGIFGIFDVASHMQVPIHYHYNDFGLTMARWGANDPKYFVMPFLGPSTDRSALGTFVDYYGLSPYPWLHPRWKRWTVLGIYYVNRRAQLLDYQSIMAAAAIDPYVFQRNAYLQRREYLVKKMDQTLAHEYAPATDTVGFFLKPTHSWEKKA